MNPATLETVDEVTESTAADVRRACGSGSRRSPPMGPDAGARTRSSCCTKRQVSSAADRAELSKLLTLEGGKPRIENLDEVEWSAACFQYYAEIARNSHGSSIPPTAEHQINFTIKEPLGVVAAIVPFNYPLLLLVWKIAPALAAGNTVVIKPSELTPLATLRMVEQALAHFPRGVVNVVTGGPATGAALVEDPDVACIAFTGSTAVGTRIGERAAAQLKRVNLELGGIDPLIVFEDADLDIAVPGAAWARFLNNGQVCTSAKRIYVVEGHRAGVHRALRGAHADRCASATAWIPTIDLGPLISERARTRVEAQVAARAGRRRAAARGRQTTRRRSGLVLRADGADRRRSRRTLSSARKCSGRSRRSRS